MATVFTIGSSGKDSRALFKAIQENNVNFLLDIRLNNTSQLAGYAKGPVLDHFCELLGIEYVHSVELAPDDNIRKNYRATSDWEQYVNSFVPLMRRREVENLLTEDDLDHTVLLCACPTPKQCHRRLVAEYYKHFYPGLQIVHL